MKYKPLCWIVVFNNKLQEAKRLKKFSKTVPVYEGGWPIPLYEHALRGSTSLKFVEFTLFQSKHHLLPISLIRFVRQMSMSKNFWVDFHQRCLRTISNNLALNKKNPHRKRLIRRNVQTHALYDSSGVKKWPLLPQPPLCPLRLFLDSWHLYSF